MLVILVKCLIIPRVCTSKYFGDLPLELTLTIQSNYSLPKLNCFLVKLAYTMEL